MFEYIFNLPKKIKYTLEKKEKITYTLQKTKEMTYKLVVNAFEILLGLIGYYDDSFIENIDELTLGYLDDEE